MAEENIVEAISKLREGGKKRNFSQSIDLIVNLKNIDVRKSENKINEIVELPNGRGKPASIVIFSDTAKGEDFKVINTSELEVLAKDERGSRKLGSSVDFFLAEPKMMPIVGKNLGKVLAPRGKMPVLIAGELNSLVKRYKNSVRVKIKDSPVIQCRVGAEMMGDDKLAENVEVVKKFLEKRLPKGRNNIKNIYVKFTMSKPVKIEA